MKRMSLENPSQKNPVVNRKESPLQLRAAVGLETGLMLGRIMTFGKGYLKHIPEGKKVIVVTSHISDIDIPVVIDQLGGDLNLKITAQSTNLDFKKDAASTFGTFVAGHDNFLPIDYTIEGDKKVAHFNPDNYDAMASALREGSEVLVAAHKPSSGALSRGGIAAPYLSQVGGGEFVILPVAVNVKSKKPFRAGGEAELLKERPDTDVFIGEPMELPRIEGIEDYAKILKKKEQSGGELDPVESEKLAALQDALRSQSDSIMKSIAEMLPFEKRGEYQ